MKKLSDATAVLATIEAVMGEAYVGDVQGDLIDAYRADVGRHAEADDSIDDEDVVRWMVSKALGLE